MGQKSHQAHSGSSCSGSLHPQDISSNGTDYASKVVLIFHMEYSIHTYQKSNHLRLHLKQFLSSLVASWVIMTTYNYIHNKEKHHRSHHCTEITAYDGVTLNSKSGHHVTSGTSDDNIGIMTAVSIIFSVSTWHESPVAITKLRVRTIYTSDPAMIAKTCLNSLNYMLIFKLKRVW